MLLGVSEEIRINVRTTREIKRDLEVTARLRGLTVSALVNSLVVKAIREEKQAEPSAFLPKGRPLATSGQKIPLGNSQLPKKKTGT